MWAKRVRTHKWSADLHVPGPRSVSPIGQFETKIELEFQLHFSLTRLGPPPQTSLHMSRRAVSCCDFSGRSTGTGASTGEEIEAARHLLLAAGFAGALAAAGLALAAAAVALAFFAASS